MTAFTGGIMALTKSGNHTIKVDINTTAVQVEEFLLKLNDEDHLRGTPLSQEGRVLLYTLGDELVEKPASTGEREEHLAAARVAMSLVFDPLGQFAEFPGVQKALHSIRTIMYRSRNTASVHDLRSPVTVLAGVQKVLYQKYPAPGNDDQTADSDDVADIADAPGTQSTRILPASTSLAPAINALNARTDRPTPQQKQVFENLLGILLSSSRQSRG
jgi:hypothetical protein